MGDPRGVTAATPGSDQSKNIPPNREAIVFTERALFQVMGMPPKLAGQMANACNGLYNNLRSGKYDQYLPKIKLSGASRIERLSPNTSTARLETDRGTDNTPSEQALNFKNLPSNRSIVVYDGNKSSEQAIGRLMTPQSRAIIDPGIDDISTPTPQNSPAVIDPSIDDILTPTPVDSPITADPSIDNLPSSKPLDTSRPISPSGLRADSGLQFKTFPNANALAANPDPGNDNLAPSKPLDTSRPISPSGLRTDSGLQFKTFPNANALAANPDPGNDNLAPSKPLDTSRPISPSGLRADSGLQFKTFPNANALAANPDPGNDNLAPSKPLDTSRPISPSGLRADSGLQFKTFPNANALAANPDPGNDNLAPSKPLDTSRPISPSGLRADSGLQFKTFPNANALAANPDPGNDNLAPSKPLDTSRPISPSGLRADSGLQFKTFPNANALAANPDPGNDNLAPSKPLDTSRPNLASLKANSELTIANNYSMNRQDTSANTSTPTSDTVNQTIAQTNAVASINTDKIAPVVDASKTPLSQTQGEALARNQATTPGTTTPTATDATLAAANTTNASKLSTALSGLGITGTQGIIGTETASTSLERQSGAAHANLPDQAALLNGAQLAQANLANTVNNPNAGNLNIQSSLAALLNPAQGGINALGRDNSVALNEQQALVGPLGTPLHPAFTSLADAEKGQILPGAIGNPLNIKEVGPTYNSSTAALSRSNIDPSALTSKDAPSTPIANAANTQATIQSFQGMLQPGQGAVKGAEDTSKTIVKGAGGPGLPDALTAIQGTGKKGVASAVEGSTGPLISMPGTLIGKGGKAIDGGDDTKLPIGQTINPTQVGAQTGLIVTAVAGAQVPGQTGAAAGQQTGTGTNVTGTTGPAGPAGSGTTTGQDPNATDIKSLVGALPAVEIYDPKENTEDEKEAQSRPEINYDSIDDDDDDDEFNDIPIIEGKRASSAAGAQIKAPKSKIGLSIIENVMVLLNDLKNKKLDDKTAQQMQLELFTDIFGKQKRRQSYMVRAEDTLETIAKYMLKDARLAPLLYTINVHAKNIPAINEEENKQAIYAITPGEQRILLPHRSEILRYKIHVLKDKEALVLYTRSSSLPESAEFTTYTCREEDTLSSIAASHIDVRDASKWAEIALLNNLSVRLNKKGEPVAKLKAGQTLRIPKAALIEEEEDEIISAALANNANTKTSKIDAGAGSVKGGAIAGADLGAVVGAGGNDNVMAGAKAGPKITVNLNFNPSDEMSISKALVSMEKRIISQSNLGSGTDNVLMRLELKQGNNRLNVAEWDVNPRSSTLRLYDSAGGCQVIPVALPTRAARELAENDLKANANRYCEMFLSGKLVA